jgi:RimJ/RimL family protein N-acetyltransferase
VVLRRMQPDDAGDLAAVVGESLDHLRPWMPWATKEAADHRTQLARITEAAELWESGTDYIYGIFAAAGPGGPAGAPGGGDGADDVGTGGEDGPLVGTIGLHRKAGEDTAEIGYWIAAGRTRRGYGTAAARAVTSVAVALPGVRQVQIHCDEENVASAAIPRKLGYRLDRIEAHEPEAPGERGRRMIWVWDRPGRDAPDGAR